MKKEIKELLERHKEFVIREKRNELFGQNKPEKRAKLKFNLMEYANSFDFATMEEKRVIYIALVQAKKWGDNLS